MFGIVKQDYMLSVKVLREMGISISEIDRISIDRSGFDRTPLSRSSVTYNNVNRVKVIMLKRGIIAFHKVGYIQ